jgi:hypothetical protein
MEVVGLFRQARQGLSYNKRYLVLFATTKQSHIHNTDTPMGYSEIPCRICGVSFNISRIRTRGERQSEAFRCTGDGKYPGFVDTTGDEACVATGGCLITKRIVERRAVFSSERENTEAFLNEDGDDEADSDYVQESADEDEYEYESDDDRHVDAIESEDIAMDDVGEDRAQGDWREFLLGNAAFQKGGETSQEDIFLPMEYLNKLEHSDQDKSKSNSPTPSQRTPLSPRLTLRKLTSP